MLDSTRIIRVTYDKEVAEKYIITFASGGFVKVRKEWSKDEIIDKLVDLMSPEMSIASLKSN